MILIMGTIKVAAGEGARAAPLLAAHAAASRAEEGCEDYAFSFDAADPDLIRVAERWASVDALAAHGKADHQRDFGRALRDHGVESMQVKAWDGQFWRTLYGD